MMLFHQNCSRLGLVWRKLFPLRHAVPPSWGAVMAASRRRWPPRLRLVNQSTELCSRAYRCDGCGSQIHVDMDWEEGAVFDPGARLD